MQRMYERQCYPKTLNGRRPVNVGYQTSLRIQAREYDVHMEAHITYAVMRKVMIHSALMFIISIIGNNI